MTNTQRSIEVPGGVVQSWAVGNADTDATPILFLHGGPGGSGRGFEPLAPLGADRPLVMFDQLGSATSTWTGEPDDLWRIERFCDEVDAVRAAWDLDEVILFGHSWGGWLATDYLCRQPSGVRGAVLADTSASFPSFAASIARRVAELGETAQRAVARYDRDRVFSDAYRATAIEFYRAFVVPDPAVAAEVIDRQRSTEVFRYMQGDDELHADGSLRTWDRRSDLGSVDAPTLVIVGRHDHMDPATAAELSDGLVNGELAVFESSSHRPHWDETDAVIARVSLWLAANGLA